MPFATSAISVYDVTVGTKMEPFFWRWTKSGKKKNLGTKTGIGSKCRDQNVFFALKETTNKKPIGENCA